MVQSRQEDKGFRLGRANVVPGENLEPRWRLMGAQVLVWLYGHDLLNGELMRTGVVRLGNLWDP